MQERHRWSVRDSASLYGAKSIVGAPMDLITKPELMMKQRLSLQKTRKKSQIKRISKKEDPGKTGQLFKKSRTSLTGIL